MIVETKQTDGLFLPGTGWAAKKNLILAQVLTSELPGLVVDRFDIGAISMSS